MPANPVKMWSTGSGAAQAPFAAVRNQFSFSAPVREVFPSFRAAVSAEERMRTGPVSLASHPSTSMGVQVEARFTGL